MYSGNKSPNISHFSLDVLFISSFKPKTFSFYQGYFFLDESLLKIQIIIFTFLYLSNLINKKKYKLTHDWLLQVAHQVTDASCVGTGIQRRIYLYPCPDNAAPRLVCKHHHPLDDLAVTGHDMAVQVSDGSGRVSLDILRLVCTPVGIQVRDDGFLTCP